MALVRRGTKKPEKNKRSLRPLVQPVSLAPSIAITLTEARVRQIAREEARAVVDRRLAGLAAPRKGGGCC